jgi:hypothetical protein
VAASRNGAFLLLSFWHGGARHTDFWCVGRWRSSEIVAESGEKKNAHRPSSSVSDRVASRSPPAALTAIPRGARSVALRSDHVSTRHQHHQQQQWPRRASRARWKLSKPQKCVTCSAPSPQLSAPRSLASRDSLPFRCRPLSSSRGQPIQSRLPQQKNYLPPRQGWKSGAFQTGGGECAFRRRSLARSGCRGSGSQRLERVQHSGLLPPTGRR